MFRSKRLCLPVFLLGAAGPPLLAQDDIPPAPAMRGEKLYGPTSGFCHGERARGFERPNLVRSQVVLDDGKGEWIGPFIAQASLTKAGDSSSNRIAYRPSNGNAPWRLRLDSIVRNGPSAFFPEGKQYRVVGTGATLWALQLPGK